MNLIQGLHAFKSHYHFCWISPPAYENDHFLPNEFDLSARKLLYVIIDNRALQKLGCGLRACKPCRANSVTTPGLKNYFITQQKGPDIWNIMRPKGRGVSS